ncbi:3',5'-cyclic-nucleotide phosphodiesterase [Halomonas sp. ML-15]|uniref:3',5'-cyclic-nucleotide phosphodiesterase n=1 Tax=Halomonas sp. ML-15 TaxID=2773305 RepID=UPI001746DEF9|nr:3',5'-cyclic-nucleotide phosphodiesterase [Halomonas sp. ML-15]MBD3898141.1 3',5'-cyclic-nucleotide phosphodiesterase [Halomonas sp. ML-15]
MKIRVLGASGGLGDSSATTAILIDQTTLLDAGTGLAHLSIDEASAIQHVFLSHAHLDHVAGLPLLVDSLYERLVSNNRALTVHALPAVIDVLQRHLFNQQLWPDFGTLPSAEQPVLRFAPLTLGQRIPLNADGTLTITPIAVKHRVPACGFQVVSPGTSFVFSGDTTYEPSVVDSLDACGAIDILMLECAFPDRHLALARQSGHMTPALVAQLLASLAQRPGQLWITHLKPIYRQDVIAELGAVLQEDQWQCL